MASWPHPKFVSSVVVVVFGDMHILSPMWESLCSCCNVIVFRDRKECRYWLRDKTSSEKVFHVTGCVFALESLDALLQNERFFFFYKNIGISRWSDPKTTLEETEHEIASSLLLFRPIFPVLFFQRYNINWRIWQERVGNEFLESTTR